MCGFVGVTSLGSRKEVLASPQRLRLGPYILLAEGGTGITVTLPSVSGAFCTSLLQD